MISFFLLLLTFLALRVASLEKLAVWVAGFTSYGAACLTLYSACSFHRNSNLEPEMCLGSRGEQVLDKPST